MPVPTDQLAADIRESDRRLTDAIGDLGHKIDANHAEFSAFRSEIGRKIDANHAEFSAFRSEIVGKLGSIETKLVEKLSSIEVGFAEFRGSTKTSLSVAKWAIGVTVPIVLGLVVFSIDLAWHASRLDALVRQHDEVLKARKDQRESVPAPIRGDRPAGVAADHE